MRIRSDVKLNWTTNVWIMNNMAARNVANMKATRNMLVPIAAFNWANPGKVSPPYLIQQKSWPN